MTFEIIFGTIYITALAFVVCACVMDTNNYKIHLNKKKRIPKFSKGDTIQLIDDTVENPFKPNIINEYYVVDIQKNNKGHWYVMYMETKYIDHQGTVNSKYWENTIEAWKLVNYKIKK